VTDAPTLYAKARSDVASMLGYDLDNLSAEQAVRLDIGSALRVLLDNQSGRLVRGESLDARELLMASEALSRLLPPLREPPSPSRPDPRQVMWEIYKGMRDRGELADSYRSPQQRLETARAKVAAIEAEIAALTPPPDEPSATPPAPAGDNVVALPRATAGLSAQATPPAPPQPQFLTDTTPEPWRPFVGDNSRWEV
jgi:hypothetical protein